MKIAAVVRRTKAFLRRKPVILHLFWRKDSKLEDSEGSWHVSVVLTSAMSTVLSLDKPLQMRGITFMLHAVTQYKLQKRRQQGY